MDFIEVVPTGHGDVRQWIGEEAEAVAGRRGADDHRGGLSCLQEIFEDSGIM